ncbi:MAG TPA: sugar phosphate isomerase/epimerase [Ohtaekwangia sp.]
MKRREFVQTAAIAAAGMVALPSFVSAMKSKKAMGLQLYSLRDIIGADPKGVLQKVASFGYKELEAYSYKDGKIFGMDYTEFCNYVKSLGMKVVSGHYGLDQIKGDTWKKAVEDAKKNKQPLMVVPYIQAEQRKSIDDYKRIIADLNAAGEVCNSMGVRMAYHNHDFEFMELDGQVPYELMLKDLDPKKVGMELDLYWVVYAGKDPLKYFEQHPGRFEAWHIKDMDKTDRKRNADVGTGSIDFKPILAKAKQSGCKYFFVEQETYPGASIDSIEASAKYLKTIL